jgi:putative tRNA adenosine deaminase-associated protein
VSAPQPAVRESWAVRVERRDGSWRVELLADDAGAELPTLEAALGEPGEWPGPFVLVVDSRLYLVVLRHGPGGMVRALISDSSMQAWVLAAEVVERYGIGAEPGGRPTGSVEELDGEAGRPGGDLDVLADDGLPGGELRAILTADDLWADEMAARIAERLGFADELAAAVRP